MNVKRGIKSEFNIEQKWQIINFHLKNPKTNLILIQHFNKLFYVINPPTTMSGILKPASVNKIMKLDDVEAFNKRIREAKYPELEKCYLLGRCKSSFRCF